MSRIVYIENGKARLVVPVIDDMEKVIQKSIPTGCEYAVVTENDLPADKRLLESWEISGDSIVVNHTKAKESAHNVRRAIRNNLFNPWDDIVSKDIPGKKDSAEIKRQAIRTKDAEIQTNIDNSVSVDEISSILDNYLTYKVE